MATFTNYATITYGGVTKDSNVVTGEIVEVLSATKSATAKTYSRPSRIGYVISLLNGGATALTGLTVYDNLGAYSSGSETVYPLEYVEGSMLLFVNGVATQTAAVTADNGISISGVGVPAGGNVQLVYAADVTEYAPLGTNGTITNTATVGGEGVATVSASSTVGAATGADLSVTKSVCPSSVTENGQDLYFRDRKHRQHGDRRG